MISDADRKDAAAALAAAEAGQAPIPPLTDTYPDLDVVDAYEIQLINIGRRRAAGEIVRGHKVGLSARAMQQMMGVNEPDYGHLMHTMFVYEADTVSTADYCFPRVEPEVGFVLGADLEGPGASVADALRATDYLVPALELIDSRIVDWKIKLPDTIADNASSAGVVVGGRPVEITEVDPRLIGAVLSRNGEVVETGAAGAVLGNPVTAVAWLANKVAEFGVKLEAGDLVLPGSCTRALDVHAGDTIRAEFDVLGHVTVNFA